MGNEIRIRTSYEYMYLDMDKVISRPYVLNIVDTGTVTIIKKIYETQP